MTIDAAGLKRMFDTIAVAIETDRDRLCQLDGVIGDADHGIAMALGFNAVRDALASLDLAAIEPTALFNTAAKSFLNAVGASSGPLYATAFMRAAAAAKGKATLAEADFIALFQAMAQGIKDRGKAEPGDKTMVQAYVLSDFYKWEAEWLEATLDAIAQAAPLLAQGEDERYQGEVMRLAPAEKADPKQRGAATED